MFEKFKRWREERKTKPRRKVHLSAEFWQELEKLGAMTSFALVDRDIDDDERKELLDQLQVVGKVLMTTTAVEES